MQKIPVRELQMMKLEALKVIDQICQKENITYFLAYGSLIGAVREKGFIAWDQDIDLMMPRKDYIEFGKKAGLYLNTDKYFLQNYDTEKYMIPPITRLCIKGTYRCSSNASHLPIEKGTFIDIFPIDNARLNDKNEVYQKCRNVYKRMCFMMYKAESKQLWKRVAKRCLQAIMKVKPLKTYQHNLVEKMTYCKEPTGILMDFAGEYGPKRECFKASWFAKTVYLPFEDGLFPCPVGYDELLTNIYGNYMTPPDEAHRKPDEPSYSLN